MDFTYSKKVPGSFHLTLDFARLQNADDPRFSRTVQGMNGNLFTLRPNNPEQGIGFSFKYQYIRGKLNPKIDLDHIYIIPFAKNRTIKTGRLEYMTGIYGDRPPKDWRAILFYAQPEDTVYAARKGLIVEIIDQYDPENINGYTFRSKANSVLIEHDDGSFAQYIVLKKNSVMVTPGQTVYPRTPLALAGTYDSPENSQLRFLVYYLYNTEKNKGKETLSNRTHYNAYIDPVFKSKGAVLPLKDESEYTVDYTETLVEKEMSKREKKKRLKAGKN